VAADLPHLGRARVGEEDQLVRLGVDLAQHDGAGVAAGIAAGGGEHRRSPGAAALGRRPHEFGPDSLADPGKLGGHGWQGHRSADDDAARGGAA
jgi:hypothetical protein